MAVDSMHPGDLIDVWPRRAGRIIGVVILGRDAHPGCVSTVLELPGCQLGLALPEHVDLIARVLP